MPPILSKEALISWIPESERWMKSSDDYALLPETYSSLLLPLREQQSEEEYAALTRLTVYKRGFSIAVLQFACKDNNLDNAAELFHYSPSYHRRVLGNQTFHNLMRHMSEQARPPAELLEGVGPMCIYQMPNRSIPHSDHPNPSSIHPNKVNLDVVMRFPFAQLIQASAIHCLVANDIAPIRRDVNFVVMNGLRILFGLVDRDEHTGTLAWLEHLKDEVPVLTHNGNLPDAYRDSLVAPQIDA